MAKDKTKYTPVFFTPQDEDRLSHLIRQEVPDLCWIDGSKWPSPEPVVFEAPSKCQKNVIYLWSPRAHKKLPCKELPSGGFQGPGNAIVILFSRCGLRDGIMQDGFFSVGYGTDDLGMVEFIEVVWKAIRSMKSATLTSYDPTGTKALCEGIADFVVGPDAAEFASESPRLAAGIVRFKAVKKEPKVKKRSKPSA